MKAMQATVGSLEPGAMRDISVQALLEWAFRRECARLVPPDEVDAQPPGISTIWVMMQRGNLGCQIDGGGSSYPHEDAEVVAAILAELPSARGGFAMAVWMAELARAGMTPDWMPGAVPRLVPQDWHQNRWGRYAKTAVLEVVTHRHRGRRQHRDVIYCPCQYVPAADTIASARRRYLEWWAALQEVRVNLMACNMLRRHAITPAMPPVAPWQRAVR